MFLVSALEREGVDTIFAYPGGASMELHQALTRSEKIRTILPRQNKVVDSWPMDMQEQLGVQAFVWPHPVPVPLIWSPVLQMHTWTVFHSLQLPDRFIGIYCKAAFQETDFWNDSSNC